MGQVGELLVKRQEDVIHDQKAILGIGGNPADFIGGQAQVQGVHDATCGGNAEVSFEVSVVVAAQGGHTVTSFEAQVFQCLAQLVGPLL